MEFSGGEALKFGWETFKRRPWFFIGATVVILLVTGLCDSLTSTIDVTLTGEAEGKSFVGWVLNLALGTLISMGSTAFFLAAHGNPDGVSLGALWHPRPFWKFLGASILVSLAVAAGLILLIVPGIIFALMFMFASFVVIEREAGPIVALDESKRMTKGYKWKLLGFILLLTLVNLLGLLALVVGALVSIPVTVLAFVHAYRVLGGRPVVAQAEAALAT